MSRRASPIPGPARRGPILQALASARTSAGLRGAGAFVLVDMDWDKPERKFHVARLVNGQIDILHTFSERDYPKGGE